MVGEHSRRKILESVTLGVAALSGIPQASSQSVDIERVSPARQISVVPGTQVLFEAAVRNLSGNYRKYLSVDGEEQFAEPDAFYGGLDRGERDVVTHTFDAKGTHRVRFEFRDGDGNRFGSVEWTVRVADDGNRPPRVERLKPKVKIVEMPANERRRRQFALRATDPDGGLDRVVWWSSQCDEVIAVSSLSGSSDTASVTYDPYGGCPLWPAVVDGSGAISWDEGWILRREDRAGHYIRIQSEGGGVANYEFTATDSVRQIDEGDTVNANRASGHVGPKRGEDLFYYQGDLTQLTVDGPATVWIDGERVDPESYPGGGEDGGSGDDQRVIQIVSEGGGVARYTIYVTGYIDQRDSGDTTRAHVAKGHVGPKRGKDTFEFGGEIESIDVDGPATVYVDGQRVNPANYGDDDAAQQNTLKIVSRGGGVANYQFSVSGSVRQRDSGDDVSGNTVSGHVGPKRGTDVFVYTGTITAFDLSGPAAVYKNGARVNPDALG